MPLAARIGDMHVCPMVTPGVPPIPHVGGPVVQGAPTVITGGMPSSSLFTGAVMDVVIEELQVNGGWYISPEVPPKPCTA